MRNLNNSATEHEKTGSQYALSFSLRKSEVKDQRDTMITVCPFVPCIAQAFRTFDKDQDMVMFGLIAQNSVKKS